MKSALLEDKFMRVLLFFDLPTRTKNDQKHAAKFRTALVKLGFFMMQFSVYMRICKGHSAARSAVSRVRGVLPPQGNVRSIIITEKQFDNMQILLGSAGFNERTNSAENVVLFDFDEKLGDFRYSSGGEMKSGEMKSGEFIALELDGGGENGGCENRGEKRGCENRGEKRGCENRGGHGGVGVNSNLAQCGGQNSSNATENHADSDTAADEDAQFAEICASVGDRARKSPRSRRKTIQDLVEKTLFEF